jgi:hypothetical protein
MPLGEDNSRSSYSQDGDCPAITKLPPEQPIDLNMRSLDVLCDD